MALICWGRRQGNNSTSVLPGEFLLTYRLEEFLWISLLTELANPHISISHFLSLLLLPNCTFSTVTSKIHFLTFNQHHLIMSLENVKILEAKSNLI